MKEESDDIKIIPNPPAEIIDVDESQEEATQSISDHFRFRTDSSFFAVGTKKPKKTVRFMTKKESNVAKKSYACTACKMDYKNYYYLRKHKLECKSPKKTAKLPFFRE